MKSKVYIRPRIKCLAIDTKAVMQVVSGVKGTTDLSTTIIDDESEGTDQALARFTSVWDTWEEPEE
jgi:hypothetical protein